MNEPVRVIQTSYGYTVEGEPNKSTYKFELVPLEGPSRVYSCNPTKPLRN